MPEFHRRLSEMRRKIDELVNRSNWYITAFVLLVVLRTLCAVFSGYHGSDIQGQLLASRGILAGRFLYTEVQPVWLQFGYPPLHAYLQAFFLLVLGDSVLSAKMPAILGDVGVGVLLYLLGRERNELFGRKFSLSYLIFPLSILSSDVLGLFDSFALFLMLGAIYFIERERDLFSSVFVSLGTLDKYLPLLALFPIAVEYIKRRRISRLVLMVLVVAAMCGAVLAPFLLTNLHGTVQVALHTGAKNPDSFSLFRIIPVDNEFIPFIFQFLAVLAVYFMVVRFHLFQDDYLSLISLFVALFVMLNKNLYPHYFLWIFPFIAFSFLKFHEDIELILVLFMETGILSIYWIDMGRYVNSGPVLPLLFQVFTWGVMGWALYREYHSPPGGRMAPPEGIS